MTDFDLKVLDNFPGKIVRKDLTMMMKKGANVPTYVLEYLLGNAWFAKTPQWKSFKQSVKGVAVSKFCSIHFSNSSC
jgi:predicted ATP-dependent Lon-type protease